MVAGEGLDSTLLALKLERTMSQGTWKHLDTGKGPVQETPLPTPEFPERALTTPGNFILATQQNPV